MYPIIKVSPNMNLIQNPAFGNYSEYMVSELFRGVDLNFSKALDRSPFSSCFCTIDYRDGLPMCSLTESGHTIYLSTHDTYYCQWLYQFAHEYCHHLINGKLSGELIGLMWFEEVICELSSMYHLHQMASDWKKSDLEEKTHWAPVFQDYLDDLLRNGKSILYQLSFLLQLWEAQLRQPVYHRDLYNIIAAKLFPLFVENPRLWKIALHFGDMRQYSSISEVLSHLENKATSDYSESLLKFRSLLLS